MTNLATVRSLMIAGLAIASVTTATLACADPPTQTAAAATTDPTFRPKTPLPAYPAESRKNKEAGVVHVKLCIDATGKVTKADLSESSGFPNLDNAVLKWIQGVQFNPAMNGPPPVALCDFPFKYEFQITKGPTRQEKTNNPFDIGPAGGLAAGP